MPRKLTSRYVEAAKAIEGKRAEIRDAAVPGLELRISAGGGKSWALRYRRKSDGAKRIVTLGEYPAFSLDDARDWAEGQKREIARGEDPSAKHKARKEAVTFAELASEWLEHHAEPNKSPRAVRDDKSMLHLHINPVIGSMKASEVRKRDIIRLLDAVKAKPDARLGRRSARRYRQRAAVQSSTQASERRMTHRPNRVFEVVRAIFRWGVGRDLLQIDPTAGISPPIKKEKARERDLLSDEIRLLWQALERAPLERRKMRKGTSRGARIVEDGQLSMTRAIARAIQLSLVTGQRIGEVIGIHRSELNLNDTAPIWIIPGERTKNREANRVPLSPLAKKVIQGAWVLGEFADEEPLWLFPSLIDPKKPLYEGAASKALARSRKALGLADFRIHDLRRTAATRMAELGIDPYHISLVLNHVSVRRGTVTGKVYNQYSYDREKRAALEKWAEYLEQIIAGKENENVVSFNSR